MIHEAGLTGKITWNGLRHTTATRMTLHKVSPFVTKDALGHKDIRTTLKYAHVNVEVMQEAMAVLNR